ncbi:holocytochrome c synthase [Blastocladiella emersonii ATCC 22665]|nr:holocytochrome c synthase [Blastocladiella emersonii ATCC 22665]
MNPPAECPMHQKAAAADAAPAAAPAKCPVNHGQGPAAATPAPAAAKCPVNHGQTTTSITGEPLNPLNNMPHLADTPQPDQELPLPTDRVESSIPSGDGARWMYPSPQQFYNALRRKGWETPEDHIEVMVDIHNHLNEEAWGEILGWESAHREECATPKLLRLRGRPNDWSPKAMFAHYFRGAPAPFDRHDWFVDRCGREVRYVIDYYAGPDEGDQPVFFLDVRPAIDSPSAAFDRMRAAASKWFGGASKQ